MATDRGKTQRNRWMNRDKKRFRNIGGDELGK